MSETGHWLSLEAKSQNLIGSIYLRTGVYNKALEAFLKSLRCSEKAGEELGDGKAMGNIGNVYASLGDYSKSNEYTYRAMAIAGKLSSDKLLGSCYVNLGDNYYRMADFYKQHGKVDSSYRYLNYLIAAKGSLFNEEKTRQIQALSFEETERQQKLEEAKVEAAEERSHNVQYAVMAVGVICFQEAGCCEAYGGGAGKGGGRVNKNKAK